MPEVKASINSCREASRKERSDRKRLRRMWSREDVSLVSLQGLRVLKKEMERPMVQRFGRRKRPLVEEKPEAVLPWLEIVPLVLLAEGSGLVSGWVFC